MAQATLNNSGDRETRFNSHALVELRRSRWLPFGVHSAVLLDLSMNGFKLEFTGEATVEQGNRFWFVVPLTPLGIYTQTQLMCRIECKWFDGPRCRMGGAFIELSGEEEKIIAQVMASLSAHGRGSL